MSAWCTLKYIAIRPPSRPSMRWTSHGGRLENRSCRYGGARRGFRARARRRARAAQSGERGSRRRIVVPRPTPGAGSRGSSGGGASGSTARTPSGARGGRRRGRANARGRRPRAADSGIRPPTCISDSCVSPMRNTRSSGPRLFLALIAGIFAELLTSAGDRVQGRPNRVKPTDVRNPAYFHKVVDCQWACPPIRTCPSTSA